MELKSNYTEELEAVIAYMNEVLVHEFPTNQLTVDYLMASILDNKKCHANLILDNCLMSHNINQLKKVYFTYLKSKQVENPITEGTPFDGELSKVMLLAMVESNILKVKPIGSEHVLLAMLNPKNGFLKVQEVFKSMGIEYEFILKKCTDETSEEPKTAPKKTIKPKADNPLKLKSEINAKALTNTKSSYITQYTKSINQMMEQGKIDPIIGRQKEIELVTKILSRRKKNNVVLVGKGGCGKTSIVHAVAESIVKGTAPEVLKDKEIVQLDVMAIISGTHFRGMFEERVNGLFNELKSNKNYILFLDDIQQVLKTSTKDRDTDLSQFIGEILMGGEVRVMATTTFKDYRNSIESNSSLSRKFQKIVIEPASAEDTIEIIERNKHYYEDYHNVSYSTEVVKKTVELAERYISDRSLPDSAIDVIDLSGAYTCLINREPQDILELKHKLIELNSQKEDLLNHGNFEEVDAVSIQENEIKAKLADFKREFDKDKDKYKIEITEDNIASAVSDITSIPINKLTTDEKAKVAHIEDILKESVIGQDDAVSKICRVIKRNKVGLGDKNKTIANVLMCGPTGVGKTLIAKKLAEEIFGSSSDMIRIDMSEYSEKSSVSKLIGASAGYIGYDNGGVLTEAVKNKQYCVLLLDEIEKADTEVYNIFLQLFDEGRLTDNSGQIVSFKNVIVLMTSNIGAKQASEGATNIGFTSDDSANKKSIYEKSLKTTFTPEFLNRIDDIIFFNALTDENLKDIITLELNKLKKRIVSLDFDLEWDNTLVDYIHSLAVKEKNMGARPILRLIQNNVEDAITDEMLLHDFEKNHKFVASVSENKVEIH